MRGVSRLLISYCGINRIVVGNAKQEVCKPAPEFGGVWPEICDIFPQGQNRSHWVQ